MLHESNLMCCEPRAAVCISSCVLAVQPFTRPVDNAAADLFFLNGVKSWIHARRALTPDFGRRDSRIFCNQLPCFGYPSNWPLGALTGCQ